MVSKKASAKKQEKTKQKIVKNFLNREEVSKNSFCVEINIKKTGKSLSVWLDLVF